MIVGYDWITQKKEANQTTSLMVRYMRTKFITRIRHLAWAGTVLVKIDEGTFYISNLAVYPEFRCSGLGTSLLSHAEEAALKSGAKTLELDVETDNENAIRLYKKFGMNIIGEPKGTVIDGEEFEFFRMSKALSPQP
jgi:ribosomal protein S18 acetylase RimI-like enzyme